MLHNGDHACGLCAIRVLVAFIYMSSIYTYAMSSLPLPEQICLNLITLSQKHSYSIAICCWHFHRYFSYFCAWGSWVVAHKYVYMHARILCVLQTEVQQDLLKVQQHSADEYWRAWLISKYVRRPGGRDAWVYFRIAADAFLAYPECFVSHVICIWHNCVYYILRMAI